MLHTNGANSELLRCLNRHRARYLVVGGLAVSYYAPARTADDLDLLIERAVANAARVRSALVALGMADFEPLRLTRPKKIHLPLKTWHHADILTPDDGFDFSQVFAHAPEVHVNGIPRIPRAEDLVKLLSVHTDTGRRDTLLLRESTTATATARGDHGNGR